jgi:hypothetical protein
MKLHLTTVGKTAWLSCHAAFDRDHPHDWHGGHPPPRASSLCSSGWREGRVFNGRDATAYGNLMMLTPHVSKSTDCLLARIGVQLQHEPGPMPEQLTLEHTACSLST